MNFTHMQIGCHVSISGGIDRAVDNAVERECSAFQIFSRNPRGWHAKEISDKEVDSFKEKLNESKIDKFATCVHMPYLPNLSSPKEESYEKSVNTLVNEVKRCSRLEIPYLVTHLGSHLGIGEEKGITQLIKAYKKAAEVKNNVTILLENTAGQKNSVGSDFKQLGAIFSQLKPAKRFGICFDTCHAFVFGYDLRKEKNVKNTFKEFDEFVGFENLKILHLNDAKGDLGSRLDRHYHIGLGNIGQKGMETIVKTINKKKVPIVLETPIDDTRDDFANVKIAKGLA